MASWNKAIQSWLDYRRYSSSKLTAAGIGKDIEQKYIETPLLLDKIFEQLSLRLDCAKSLHYDLW